ncbi:FAD-dependent oxidoreductase [Parahaliea sp. F7430]|uniref:FAD-dependent oxidoreductase n=1 Tax=Sediminihaliea albiluteola TaxID=2758564 RepID=A0A7W2TW87_9GAMM|nr:FAD-dependent oxidoreductase [Sediminihaliea albiluteola]MBA6413066.1 FAD-dependent oxidoreductase [Sediminihaliea albiluteola]
MKLLEAINIGRMQIKNRMVMAAMTTNYANEDQSPSARLQDYLVQRAKGGVGLITVEVCTVDVRQKYQPQSMSLGSDEFIAAHRQLTDAIHQYGAKVQPQITHPGPESMISVYHGEMSVGPSHGVAACHGMPARELAIEEFDDIVESYAQASRRAREAGYDGIELHAAHAYMLLGCFLSPLKNKRADDYGADTVENRTRLLLRVIHRIKAVAGQDFPITLRISGFERVPGGRDSYDSAVLAPILERAGVDAFHVSGGISDPMVSQMICGPEYQYGYNLPEAEAIKQVVNVPVMVVGRFLDPEFAEHTLQNSNVDMIVMGRPFLADPELPNKVARKEFDSIRRCISCQNCIDSMFLWPMDAKMNCAVNAATGRERELNYQVAAHKKHILVIGAGPAGMEAARVAALRGHRVTLMDKRRRLGGSLVLASTVHSDNERFLNYLKHQVRHLDIDIRLGEAVNLNTVQTLNPDEVIVATGAKLQYDDIPGITSKNVLTGSLLRDLANGEISSEAASLPSWLRFGLALSGPIIDRHLSPSRLRKLADWWLPLGKKVVIIGGDLAAIELAEFLAARKRDVHLLEKGPLIAAEIGPKRRFEHEKRLEKLAVRINTRVNYSAITESGVEISLDNGDIRLIPADSILLAGEPVADSTLYNELINAGFSCHAVGDVTGLGLIVKATAEGNAVAQRL